MIEFLHSANGFLNEYQLLVLSLGVPLLSAIVAMISSSYAIRRSLREAKVQRNFESTLKLADFRQNWINEFRNDVAEYSALCLVAPEFEDKKEVFTRIMTLSNRIKMRMNPTDPDYKSLLSSLRADLHDATRNKGAKYALDEIEEISPSVGRRILKREWERLKTDLGSAL